MGETFSRPLVIFKVLCEFSICQNGCENSIPPKNETEIAFQASVLFLLGFRINVICGWDKQFMWMG